MAQRNRTDFPRRKLRRSTGIGWTSQLEFTVDSALLRELGERLVGQAHIALAELIRNAYDADATAVHVTVSKNRIDVADNGHGMDRQEFADFWMRIGSPHKQAQAESRGLGRTLTGSKGIGRLAVQFLANQTDVHTVSDKDDTKELHATVDWDAAVVAGELTEATASVTLKRPTTDYPLGSSHGTLIRLTNLSHEWEAENFRMLAREVWYLQPPFAEASGHRTTDEKSFTIHLTSADEDVVDEFQDQMRAYLSIWYARIVGKQRLVDEGTSNQHEIVLSLEFSDGESHRHNYRIEEPALAKSEFEIRIYHLQHRQRLGIRVAQAREYLNQYGGVHVYDTGFHLPYYGPEQDWLGIEQDHAHRRSLSSLLPQQLQTPGGLTFLPTNSRIFGVVHVSTAEEQLHGAKHKRPRADVLKIQISRDRLVENRAYERLKSTVRYALDFYAVKEKERSLDTLADRAALTDRPRQKFRRVNEVLEYFQNDIPQEVYDELHTRISDAVKASETEAERSVQQLGLMGALATAGISTLAYEHQIGQQMHIVQDIGLRLRELSEKSAKYRQELEHLTVEVDDWMKRTKETRRLFLHLLDEENRDKIVRLRAKAVLDDVTGQLSSIIRGIPVDTSFLPRSLRLPQSTFAEWSAIFQNILINAVNALIDVEEKRILITSESDGGVHWLWIQDTGVGIDLDRAEELFEPFARFVKVSTERRSLGLGGAGMGLTIVRMIANNLGCNVSFEEPDHGYSTAFQLCWSD